MAERNRDGTYNYSKYCDIHDGHQMFLNQKSNLSILYLASFLVYVLSLSGSYVHTEIMFIHG